MLFHGIAGDYLDGRRSSLLLLLRGVLHQRPYRHIAGMRWYTGILLVYAGTLAYRWYARVYWHIAGIRLHTGILLAYACTLAYCWHTPAHWHIAGMRWYTAYCQYTLAYWHTTGRPYVGAIELVPTLVRWLPGSLPACITCICNTCIIAIFFIFHVFPKKKKERETALQNHRTRSEKWKIADNGLTLRIFIGCPHQSNRQQADVRSSKH